jgi:ribosome-associated toxin RatA of RatAB toxin-antitoxin module
MTTVKKSRHVNYSCEQMYDLVNDVERYAEFLPYFSRSEVHHRDAD